MPRSLRQVLTGFSLLALSVVLFTTLGAAKPVPSPDSHRLATHVSITPPALVGKRIPITDPNLVNPATCVDVSPGSWVMHPVNNDTIYITPSVFDCSGVYHVDSITWSYGSGSEALLTNWWFYTNCGDFFSAMSGTPSVDLSSSNPTYTATIGKDVPNPNNFDVDSKFSNGSQWSACM